MKRYLSKLDKIEKRKGEDYFVLKSLRFDLDDSPIHTEDLLIPKSGNQFADNTLYGIDYNEHNQSTQIFSICTREELEKYVQPDNSQMADNNLYELLSWSIKNKKSLGWAIDTAREMFPPKPGEASYWPDIEFDVYDLLKKNPSDTSLWREAINHDPKIFNYALSQEDWNVEFIENYIKNISIIFDIEGNAHKGTGKEYAYFTAEEPNAKESLKRGDQTLNEDQWEKLEEAIKQKEIIIGHKIRLWDLILLKKRNENFGSPEKYKSRIWDTMEIEILLNPSRPCFALNAENGHKAANDVRDNKKLFRQQLYMILGSEKLYERAKPFLPKDFVSVIEISKEFIFSSDINSKIISRYNEDEHNSLFYKPANIILPFELDVNNAKTLIIANKHFWQSIFEKYTPKFKCSDESLDIYNRIDINSITKKYREPQNVYEAGLKAIADCYIAQGKPLNIKQIPKIIRKNIKDSILRQFVETTKDTDSKVICIDPHNVQDIIDTERVYILDNFGLPEVLKIQLSEEQITKITSSVDDYSEQVTHLQLNSEQISELGIPICQYKKYWLTQFEPHAFVILCEISGKELEDYIKKRYPIAAINLIQKDNKDKKFDNKNEDIADIDEQEILSPTEYWGKRVEKLRTTKTDFAKIFVVDTLAQASSVNRYLDNNIEHKKTHQILDKAQEDKNYIGVLALESLRQNQGNELFDFNIPFTFILNDSKLISTSKKNSEIKKSVENLKQELSIWGEGSEVFLLEDIKSSSEEYDQGRAEICFAKDEKPLLTIDDFEDVKNFIFKKYGYKEFRNVQEPAIKNIISNEGQTHLIIVPTGGGKSTIFQGPILYKACKLKSHKLSVVITPLQALMEDQVNELIDKYHFDKSLVAFINANTTYKKRNEIKENIRQHKLSLLYISPEKFMLRNFFEKVIKRAANEQGIDSIIFDEAHCITAWGMDFRSDYVLALRKCKELQARYKNITIQMYTATLPYQSMQELKAEGIDFGVDDVNIIPRKSDSAYAKEYKNSLCPIQDHIELVVKKLDASKEDAFEAKMKAIKDGIDNYQTKQNLLDKKSRMIVFTRSRDDAEKAAEWFKNNLSEEFRGRVAHFHAKIKPSGEKDKIIKNYKNGQILILCATKAFGLGMNIPNIHYVFHLAPPTFIEDYLQEVGRAGRDGDAYKKTFPQGEPIKAVCFYTSDDLKGKIDRVECLSPQDIRESFNLILEENFDNKQGTYVIPLRDEKFQQCINWLSKSNGLNRISVGFKCPETYDLGVAENVSGLNEDSRLNLLLKFLGVDKGVKKNRVIIHTNEIISKEDLHINSPEELECIIEDGIQLGVFNRDYSYIHVSLKDKEYLKRFVSGQGNLLVLEHILEFLTLKNNSEQFKFDDEINKLKESESIIKTIKNNWGFFLQLNVLFPISEIKEKLEALIKALGNSRHKTVSWKTLSESINAEDNPNMVKLFLLAAYKLGYATRSEICTDYIEIKINDKKKINDTNKDDKEALEEIAAFYDNKQLRAGAMCGLIEDFTTSEKAKKTICEYSQCPDEQLDKLTVIANNANRLSASKSLEHTISNELNDEEQRPIYDLESDKNINVRAGAGSGKTRLLIYRALKLILAEGNKESNVLILAYNAAVRNEIEKRMFEYSQNIGFTIKDAQIYTFHSFAVHCKPKISQKKFEEWEELLLNDIIKNRKKYENTYQYILIDEFQDVTSTRLEIIRKLLDYNTTQYLHARAFVIGDMFQSIYGYEKKKDNVRRTARSRKIIDSIEPIEYYNDLENNFKFKKCELKCNYRSYQTIINTAECWFDNLKDWSNDEKYKSFYNGLVPNLKSMILDDDFSPSSDSLDTITRDGEEIKIIKPYKIIKRDSEYDWKNDFESIWNEFLNNRLTWGANPQNNPCENHFCSIGILFRGNADVQEAYNWLIKQDYLTGKDIYVQGADVFYYSTREFYFFRKKLEEGDGIASKERIDAIYNEMNAQESEDKFDDAILEVARDLALYIVKEGGISCMKLSSEFYRIAKSEQENLREFLYRRQKDSRISICVSTIHKIKGLEFDCVIIPASTCPIGFNNENMSDGEKNMEERRLMYVAFSRAKYMLYYYEGERECKIKNNTAYAGEKGKCYANDGQSKVDCGYLVKNTCFAANNHIRHQVKIDNSIELREGVYNYDYGPNTGSKQWLIYHHNNIIGCLSSDNKLLPNLYKTKVTRVSGLFVKSVNVIEKENEMYHHWNENPNAEQQGYVYYIDYYGCINLNTGNGKQN